jgi:HSP20 family protein
MLVPWTHVRSAGPAQAFGFRRDWDALLDFAFDGWPLASGARSVLGGFRDEETSWVLTTDVPGLAPSDLDVNVRDGVLTVSGRVRRARDGWSASHRERRDLAFRRSWSLPKDAAADGVTANLADGVLTLTVPRRPEAASRSIPVTTH